MVHSAQTVHLFWVKISNVSKWTEMSFHLNIITSEYHWVRSKWLLSLWYIWRKLCTYLALTLTLTLSPNRPKWDFTWPTSPRVSIGCVQNDSKPIVCSAQTEHPSCVKIHTISKQTKMCFPLSLVNLEYHRVRPKWFMILWYVWHKPCNYLALTQTPSRNGRKQASTWATSPNSSIGLVQNDF
jgi:hypothetical protein